MSRPVAIFPGTFEEASDYIESHGLSVRSTRIILGERDLICFSGADIYFIGSYKENPTYNSDAMKYLRFMAEVRKIKFIGEES